MQEKKQYRFWQIWMRTVLPICFITVAAGFVIICLIMFTVIMMQINRSSEIAWELSEELSVSELPEHMNEMDPLNLEVFHMVAAIYDRTGNIVYHSDVNTYFGDKIYKKEVYQDMLETISTLEGNYDSMIYEDISSPFCYIYTYGAKGIVSEEGYSLVYAGVNAPWMMYGDRFIFIGLVILGLMVLLTYIIAKSNYKIYIERLEMENYYKFMANALAHDLKTPLMIVSGYAENLLENVHNEKKEHYANAIVKTVSDVNQMVEEMLQFTGNEQNRQQLEKEDYNIRKATEEVLEKYQNRIQEKDIIVSIQGHACVPASKQQMNRVLDNLVGNAVKYTPWHGAINIVIDEKEYRITNTAAAIPKRKIKELWKPFVKGDKVRNDIGGNGLGLAIVKQILEQHNLPHIMYSEENSVTVRIGLEAIPH